MEQSMPIKDTIMLMKIDYKTDEANIPNTELLELNGRLFIFRCNDENGITWTTIKEPFITIQGRYLKPVNVDMELKGLAGELKTDMVKMRTVSNKADHYRLARKKDGTIILQGGYPWYGEMEGGVEWREIPIIDLDE